MGAIMEAAVTCVFQAIRPTPVRVLLALERWTTITVPRVSTACFSYLSMIYIYPPFVLQQYPFTLRVQ